MRAVRLLALCLFLAASAFAAPRPFECRWTEQPIIIDGLPDDPAWTEAHVIDSFAIPWEADSPKPRAATRARLLWDREWLYFLAEMDDADVWADRTEHDSDLWENDVFELFFKPAPNYPGYYEFQVNAAGAVFDAFFPKADSFHDPKARSRGQFHLEAHVTVRGTLNKRDDRDLGWIVEGRIPWSDLAPTGGRPVPGETWSINLARYDYTRDSAQPELTSAAPLTQLSFHRTHEYAPIKFLGPPSFPREAWHNTRLIGTPEGPSPYTVERVWPRLAAKSLVTLALVPGTDSMLFIEQHGYREGRMSLRRFRTTSDGSDVEHLLDLDDTAYSIAFHPRFAENGYVFIGSNGPQSPGSKRRVSRVTRYTMRDARIDPASRTVIIEWDSNGHDGAALAFDGAGMLFVTSGDGTGDSDTDNSGQDTRSLRSKILRIDVDRPDPRRPYSIPADNPFIHDSRFAPETWAYGLRNPWRLTFDAKSNQLWVGENGQDLWEYARLVRRGENYGWSRYEGSHVFQESRPLGPHPVTFPTIEHSHAEFRSLTGGIVYRGPDFPELDGAYIYGDWGTGRIWAAHHGGANLRTHRELTDTPLAITDFTHGPNGELLIADYGSSGAGAIYRLRKNDTPPPAQPFPEKLSDTALFTDLTQLAPAPGVIPYTLNAPAWHDAATAFYHLAVPDLRPIDVTPVKSWVPPDGTVLAQTLSLAGRRIETRLLIKQQNDWAGYSYTWNPSQTDASLAPKGGATIEIPGETGAPTPWRIPSRAECLMCHSRQAGFTLTLHEAQLNHHGQLPRWERLGLLRVETLAFENDRRHRLNEPALPNPAPNQRQAPPSPLLTRSPHSTSALSPLLKFHPPSDAAAPIEARARTYLAVNCAHCHTMFGGGNSPIDFDWVLPLRKLNAIGQPPLHGTLGLDNPYIIFPGNPGRSIIIPRVSLRAPGQMPPIGTLRPDPEAPRILAEWITTLQDTPAPAQPD